MTVLAAQMGTGFASPKVAQHLRSKTTPATQVPQGKAVSIGTGFVSPKVVQHLRSR